MRSGGWSVWSTWQRSSGRRLPRTKRGLTASALAWGWVPGESELSRAQSHSAWRLLSLPVTLWAGVPTPPCAAVPVLNFLRRWVGRLPVEQIMYFFTKWRSKCILPTLTYISPGLPLSSPTSFHSIHKCLFIPCRSHRLGPEASFCC